MDLGNIPVLNISQIARITKINPNRLYKEKQRRNLKKEEIQLLEKLEELMKKLLEEFEANDL